ncbi:ATP-grasp ribosomal peptide maturase [Thermobifida alba]|uniref:ATP-grasp ribosomal peptide maturase n=1 Tax=Thermobifida alba TaxID=53522 RepID=A0ABY4KYE3_THEAE|nr:ATP-grasp ribosomal peptide maturase [Thermobifida alba]UPT20445.1 ATP-grasp ribosomal peptide maturase [Thermobifida alba]
MTVLILTNTHDPTADDVIMRLRDRGTPVFRLDPADFPQRAVLHSEISADGWLGTLATEHRTLDLSTVTGVWYRRPRRFLLPEQMSRAERGWAADEARRGFGGIINTLPGWLNPPAAIGRAEYKPYQLHQAVRAGLAVPRTLVTSDPEQARAWCAQVGDVVYKPLGAATWSEDGSHYAVYTTPLSPDEWGDPAIGRTAHLFQRRLDKQYEVRLTMVDDQAFPAAIHAHSDRSRTDWRTDYKALTYSIPPVPRRVLAGACTLLRLLDLRYAALDFVVEQGQWWFLEANPNGQYGWIQHQTGQQIGDAIADALTRKEPNVHNDH